MFAYFVFVALAVDFTTWSKYTKFKGFKVTPSNIILRYLESAENSVSIGDDLCANPDPATDPDPVKKFVHEDFATGYQGGDHTITNMPMSPNVSEKQPGGIKKSDRKKGSSKTGSANTSIVTGKSSKQQAELSPRSLYSMYIEQNHAQLNPAAMDPSDIETVMTGATGQNNLNNNANAVNVLEGLLKDDDTATPGGGKQVLQKKRGALETILNTTQQGLVTASEPEAELGVKSKSPIISIKSPKIPSGRTPKSSRTPSASPARSSPFSGSPRSARSAARDRSPLYSSTKGQSRSPRIQLILIF